MKHLHRAKCLSAYEGARIVLKQGMVYPAYMLLKEAARGVLSYMAEDFLDKEISEKSKLTNLIDILGDTMLNEKQKDGIKILIDAEKSGLDGILVLDVNDMYVVKRAVKSLIIEVFKEPV